jgi:hypothetical protein
VGAPDLVTLCTALAPPFPNPFNPRTSLGFVLARGGAARLEIFDLAGRRVRTLVDESLAAGQHERVWDGAGEDGRRLPSGAYLARLTAGGVVEVRKLLIAK